MRLSFLFILLCCWLGFNASTGTTVYGTDVTTIDAHIRHFQKDAFQSAQHFISHKGRAPHNPTLAKSNKHAHSGANVKDPLDGPAMPASKHSLATLQYIYAGQVYAFTGCGFIPDVQVLLYPKHSFW